MRNFSKESLISAIASESLALNHSTALRELSGCSMAGSTSQPLTRRKAFQILLQKFSAVFAEFFVEEDVVACGCGEHDAHADSVGSVVGYEFEGVG